MKSCCSCRFFRSTRTWRRRMSHSVCDASNLVFNLELISARVAPSSPCSTSVVAVAEELEPNVSLLDGDGGIWQCSGWNLRSAADLGSVDRTSLRDMTGSTYSESNDSESVWSNCLSAWSPADVPVRISHSQLEVKLELWVANLPEACT